MENVTNIQDKPRANGLSPLTGDKKPIPVPLALPMSSVLMRLAPFADTKLDIRSMCNLG